MAFIFKSRTTHDAMVELLNAENEDEQDRLTEKWKDNKIEELNFVGIVVCILHAPTRFSRKLSILQLIFD